MAIQRLRFAPDPVANGPGHAVHFDVPLTTAASTGLTTQAFDVPPNATLIATVRVQGPSGTDAASHLIEGIDGGAGLTWVLLGHVNAITATKPAPANQAYNKTFLYYARTTAARTGVRVRVKWTGTTTGSWRAALGVGGLLGAGEFGTLRYREPALLHSAANAYGLDNYATAIDCTTTQPGSVILWAVHTNGSQGYNYEYADRILDVEQQYVPVVAFAVGPYEQPASRGEIRYVWSGWSSTYSAGIAVEVFPGAAPAQVTAVTDNGANVAGGKAVTITGNNFDIATGVTFGGVPATDFVIVNMTTITCTVPAHEAGVVDVVVLSPEGDGTLANGFTYYPSAVLTDYNPKYSALGAGTRITLTGQNFTGTKGVLLGGVAATSVTVAPDGLSLTCIAPAHAAGVGDFVLQHYAEDITVVGGMTFTAPIVNSVTPGTADTNGLVARTVSGYGLFGTTGVTFGGTAADQLVVAADGCSVQLRVPAHAVGTVDVVATTALASGTGVGKFRYRIPVDIGTITPPYGPTTGGTPITVAGVGFEDPASLIFLVDGVPATDVVVIDEQTITAKTPAHSPGITSVELISGDLSTVEERAFQFFETARLDTVEGTIYGGETATFSSASGNYLGVTGVRFGGVPATDVVVSADGNTLTCTVPAHADGVVDVTLERVPTSTTAGTGGLKVWEYDVLAKHGTTSFTTGKIFDPAVGYARELQIALPQCAVEAMAAGDHYLEIGFDEYQSNLEANAGPGGLNSWPMIFQFVARPGTALFYAYSDLPHTQSQTVRFGAGNNEMVDTNCGEGAMRFERRRILPTEGSYSSSPGDDWLETWDDGVQGDKGILDVRDGGGPEGFDLTSFTGWLRLGSSDNSVGRDKFSGTISYVRVGLLSPRTTTIASAYTYITPEKHRPVLANLVPADGAALGLTQSVSFDITDEENDVGSIVITAAFEDWTETIYHTAGGFRVPYETSARVGNSFTITRTGGWPGVPTFTVYAVDQTGLELDPALPWAIVPPENVGSAPVLQNISPAGGGSVAPTGHITFDVADPDANLQTVIILAEYADGKGEVVFGPGGFAAAFAGSSVSDPAAGTKRFDIVRTPGWLAAPSLVIYAIDQVGREAS